MYHLIMIFHALIGIVIIGLVLMQHGKGADIGATFGSGASGTVFGSQGTGGFLFKLTGFLALTFFVTSLSLSSIIANHYRNAQEQAIPATHLPQDNKIPMPMDAQ